MGLRVHRLPIRVLPPAIAARIAAGEVIERPASIVKELIENSLDAGATRLSVEIAAGGADLIRVSDDGSGIEPGELEAAFQRHATSKFAEDDELFRILTLGFRGEALPSIAAVAEVELVSRPHGREAAAALRLGPGLEPRRAPRGAPAGTTVSVRRLFEGQPARRKFLRGPAAEANAVAAVVSHCALAYPEVRFSLAVDGRQALATAGSGDPRDAVAAVYGPSVAAALLPVTPGEGPIQVSGLTSPPGLSRSSRAYISLFVNRRWVQNRRLLFAVEEAYRGLLMTGRHPLAVIHIQLPYEDVDVNVHPQKAEVRFRDESAVFAAVQRAVRRAVMEAAPVPAAVLTAAAPPAPPLTLEARPSAPPLWEHALRLESGARRAGAGPAYEPPEGPPTPRRALPVLRVIGQFGAVYIIAEGPDGMYLIDQHAAHERVLYERLRLQRERAQPDLQGLLEPLALELPPRQRAVLLQESDALAAHGFQIEQFGEAAFIVRAVPSALAAGDLRGNITRFLDRLLDDPAAGSADRVAASLACHAAVRAGKTLALEEMRDLIAQLEGAGSPNTCPHGRPTMVHVSAGLLAKEFGRR
jgi:DNA mismatch repair protein MutL